MADEVLMTEYQLPYGSGKNRFSLPDNFIVSLLEPGTVQGLENPRQSADEELASLQGLFPAQDGRRTVAIAINDKTRPVPHNVLLPALLEALRRWGYRKEDITFIIAVGAHLPMSPEEFFLVIPEGVAEGYSIISHDADDEVGLVNLGKTTAGTPCLVNRTFLEADLRIVVGAIEPHQFMGWSGGVKSAAIGLASRETIACNHSLLSREGAGPCRFENNPVRQDVEEMGRLIAVHLALNVVMNSRKEIVSVLAGDPVDVMLRGIPVGEDLFSVAMDAPAQLVIVSAGGSPKDINFYQAQKALRHGARAAAPGAPVIVVAACSEGVGSRQYQDWMADKDSHETVIKAFESEEFRLGHHKGMLIADDAVGRDVFLVSGLPDAEVRSLLLEPVDSVEAAVERIQAALPDSGPVRVALIPYGNSTVPQISGLP